LLYRPSLRWGGEENGKKKAKLVGQDKGSLTGQQRKLTLTTITNDKQNIQDKGIHRAILSLPDAQCTPEQ